MRIVAVLVAVLVAQSAGARPNPDVDVSAWIPFDHRNGHILFVVVVGGEEVIAMLDSGSNALGVSQRLYDRNADQWKKGKRARVKGAFDEKVARLSDNVTLELFGFPMEYDNVMPIDLGIVDVLVGLPFFYDYIVQIDYPNSRMRIMDRKKVNLRDFSNLEMTHSIHGSLPTVRVDVDGDFRPWVTLDTGSNSGVILSRQWADEFDWLERYEKEEQILVGSLAASNMETFRVPSFTFGPFKMADVLVSVPVAGKDISVDDVRSSSTRKTQALTSRKKKPEGIVGYDVLKHFVLTIDYRRALMNVSTSAE